MMVGGPRASVQIELHKAQICRQPVGAIKAREEEKMVCFVFFAWIFFFVFFVFFCIFFLII